MRLSKKLVVLMCTSGTVFAFNIAFAQNITANQNAYFYAGLDLNVATLYTNTSIKPTLGIKVGYNKSITNHILIGPQIKVIFINNPINHGVRASLFAGASSEFEVTKLLDNDYLNKDINQYSSRLSWICPINLISSNYFYKDCISLSVSLKSDKFNFYRSSLDLNLDFQGYDIGFYNGYSRMLNLSTGSISAFK